MKLLVGLGNPGKQYEHTRHNIGFRVVDRISPSPDRRILKPQTFMNLSGTAVANTVSFYKIPLADILVIYDDTDIPFGTIRLRKRGSAGTHNGMKSVIESLGSGDFARLRIGVGPVPAPWQIKDFVLADFSAEEEKLLSDIIQHAADAAVCFTEEGIDRAMNRFNQDRP